jgi:hypothetical protein
MNLNEPIDRAAAVAREQQVTLGPLKSSIFEFGNWILCFQGSGDVAEWWAAVDDLDGEAMLI